VKQVLAKATRMNARRTQGRGVGAIRRTVLIASVLFCAVVWSAAYLTARALLG